jgi:glucose-1-phosphate adenylyltransferase
VDVGTINSYWQAHMDLLTPSKLNLFDRNWIIHTRTEERPPSWIENGAVIENSMVSNGCQIKKGARVIRSILSPGVIVESDAVIEESIILTDAVIESGAKVVRSVLDKRSRIGKNACVGGSTPENLQIAMIGKNSNVPNNAIVKPGGTVGCDVTSSDYASGVVESGVYIQTRRLPNEI